MKKVRILLFSLFAICMMSFPNSVFAAGEHTFNLKAVKCPVDDYANDGLSGDDIYYACMEDYDGGLLDTYEVGNGGNIDPGTTLMLVLNYVPGTSKTMVSFNSTINYDTTSWTSIHPSTSDFYMENTFPKSGRSTKWALEMNLYAPGVLKIVGGDDTNFLPLTTEMKLYYMFLKLNDDVTAGKSLELSFSTKAGDNVMADAAAKKLPIQTQNLTLSVYGASSTDASLSTLTVKNGTTTYPLDPTFAPGDATKKTYTAVVPNEITSVDLDATVTDENASILAGGLGTKTVNVGDNTFNIIISSQLGNTETYQVHVYRLSNDASLSNLTLTNNVSIESFSSTKYNYTASVPYSTTQTTVTGTPTHQNAYVETGNGNFALTNFGTTINTKNVVVKAENCLDQYANVPGNSCSSQNYRIDITRTAPSTNNNLSSLTVDGTSVPGFNKNQTTYTLPNVATTKSQMVIAATVEDTGKAKIKSGTGTVSLKVGDNTFNVVVEAEDQSTKTYEIHVRRLSNNIKLSNLTVTSTPQGTLTPTFSSSFMNTYTYTYDPTVTEITVTATVEDTGNAKVAIVDISTDASQTGTPTPNTATETFQTTTTKVGVIVTAEDGSTHTYPITLTRPKSSNNYLSSLTLSEGTLSPTFQSTRDNYTASVPGTVENVDVTAVPADPYAKKVEIIGNTNLQYGVNTIQVKVTAENDQVKTYTISLTREKRTDATLKDLTVNGTTITGFSPEKTTYTLTDVNYNTHQLNIVGTPNDDLATKTGDGLISLKTGANKISVVVTAHDGTTTKTYTIDVNRTKNNSTEINAITLAGVTATRKTGTDQYEVTVPYSVADADTNNLIVTVANPIVSGDKKATYTFTPTTLLTTQTTSIPIRVTAEDGTQREYTLIVTRQKNNDATLKTLTVSNGSFSPSFQPSREEYTVIVPVGTTDFDVTAVPTDPNANVTSGAGHYTMTNSTMTVEIVVVSEDLNVTKKYKLNIERTKSSVNTLSNLTVSEGTLTPAFRADETAYTVNVAGNIDSIDVAATLTDPQATIVSGTGSHNLNVGSNTITVRVRSESGAILDYTITVIRAQKEDNDLTDLTVDGVSIPGFDKDTLEYTLDDVEYAKTSITIGATLSDRDARVTGTGRKGLTTGMNTFEVVVTAQNGTQKTYTIHITREKNNNAKLSMLSVNGHVLTPNFNKDTKDYEITVDSTKDTLSPNEVVAIAEDTNAKVEKQAEITLSTTIDNFYEVTVTAENGVDQETYTIKVIRPRSSNNNLIRVNLKGASITPAFQASKHDYTLTIPYGSTKFEIEGIPEVTTTTVFGNGEYQSTTSTVQLTTQAEDGQTAVYNFTVVQAQSNDATLSDLSVTGHPLDKEFQPTGLNYSIGNITYGTSQVLVNASATNVDSTIEYYLDGVKQDSNLINIPNVFGQKTISVKVTAADGITEKTYNITYNLVASTNAYLSSLVPSEGTLDFLKTKMYYELTVAHEVTSIDLSMTTEDSNASVSANGESFFTPKTITIENLTVGNNPVSIIVTAQDTKTKETYNVVIKRLEKEASHDANLSSLSITNHPLDKVFQMEELEYSIGKIPFGETELEVNATLNMGTSSIKYLVNGVEQSSNVVAVPKTEGPGAIVVQVTAEDGQTVKNYKITYEKEASTNAYLSNIVVSQGTLTFEKNTFEYTVNVDRTVSSIDITATTEDPNAQMQMNKVAYTSPHTLTISPLESGDTEVTILVTAENGSTLSYKVTINKEADLASTITSAIFGHTIKNGYIYTVALETTGSEMKDQLDNPNEYLEIWTADESEKVSDTDPLATGMIVKLIIDGTEKDRKTIVIKGDTSGDGEIDLFDSVKIINHYLELENKELVGAYLEAAYVNEDTDVDLFDSVKVINHYLGTSLIH